MQSRKVIDLRGKAAKGQETLFAMPVRAPKRPLPLRARRRRVRAWIALGVLLLLVLLTWSVSFVSYLPRFSVATVTVVGVHDVPQELVRNYVNTVLDDGSYHLISRRNIFFYPHGVIERAVVGFFPRIASAKVTRPNLFSTEIIVTVAERQPFARWCLSAQAGFSEQQGPSGQCFEMDKGGFLFSEVPAAVATSTEYVFEGGLSGKDDSHSPIGRHFIPAHLPGLLALLTELGQSGFAPHGASIESNEDFFVSLTRGFYIKASFGEDGDMLVRNLKLVLSSDSLRGKESSLEYIDLRFGDRVYYKFEGEAEVTGSSQ